MYHSKTLKAWSGTLVLAYMHDARWRRGCSVTRMPPFFTTGVGAQPYFLSKPGFVRSCAPYQ